MNDAELLRSALRALADEVEWVRTDYARSCAQRGASPRRIREAICLYVTERATVEGRGSRLGRRISIVKLCDLDGHAHKVAASMLGLSRAQFYRERRLAIEHIANEMRRGIEDMSGDLPEGTIAELMELHTVLKSANTSGNRIIAALAAKTRAAITALQEEQHGAIAL